MNKILSFVLFFAVAALAIFVAPNLGEKTDMGVETGYLQAPDIEHGHDQPVGHGEQAEH